jgi:hypothetical protein
MAVYKIFPYKDTTLYSFYPDMNTGIDPINQVSNLNFALNSLPQVARPLIAFDPTEISNTISSVIESNTFETYLKSFIATAQGIVESSILEVWPIATQTTDNSSEWNQGTGTYLDSPITTDGACWESPFFADGDGWPGIVDNISSSYNATYAPAGGGSWYTGSTSYDFNNITASFEPRSEKDLNINVTDIVQAWTSSEIDNHGFLLKWEGSAEFNTSKLVQPVLQYYGVDTNTIYPPQLEFRWDDSVWDTGSSSTTILDKQNLYISLAENPGIFYSESVNRFRLNVREKYPARVYSTSSMYTTQHYLPSASAWYAVKDLDTNEYVVDFDTSYTRLSADSSSSYFDLYMNGLEPERYYKILLKVDAGGSTTIYDDEYYFKVVNG